jgi:hypothetical protein
MPHYQNFELGPVIMADGGAGFGFQNEYGAPLLFITYPNEETAQAARADIQASLHDAMAVSTPGF